MKSTPPPKNLGATGAALWKSIQNEYAISDAGGVELLTQICHAADRAKNMSDMIKRDGEVIETKMGPKDHPCLKHEISNRAFVVRGIQKLGLNLEPVKPGKGNPGLGGLGVKGKLIDADA
jgi:hypothetical protein